MAERKTSDPPYLLSVVGLWCALCVLAQSLFSLHNTNNTNRTKKAETKNGVHCSHGLQDYHNKPAAVPTKSPICRPTFNVSSTDQIWPVVQPSVQPRTCSLIVSAATLSSWDTCPRFLDFSASFLSLSTLSASCFSSLSEGVEDPSNAILVSGGGRRCQTGPSRSYRNLVCVGILTTKQGSRVHRQQAKNRCLDGWGCGVGLAHSLVCMTRGGY